MPLVLGVILFLTYFKCMVSLTVKNLTKKFGRAVILNDLSFEASDTTLGIQGPNGSGKSTLLKTLSGLYTPTNGDIEWTVDSKPIPLKEIRFLCGYAAPYLNLYDELSIFENLAFLSKVSNRRLTHDDARQVLEQLGLEKKLETPFKELSSGQQQRVKLSAAFLGNPKILILDEPGSNLDEAGKAAVFNLITLAVQSGSFIIIASNLKEELDFCKQTISVS